MVDGNVRGREQDVSDLSIRIAQRWLGRDDDGFGWAYGTVSYLATCVSTSAEHSEMK
jgi:hypothetical protein